MNTVTRQLFVCLQDPAIVDTLMAIGGAGVEMDDVYIPDSSADQSLLHHQHEDNSTHQQPQDTGAGFFLEGNISVHLWDI